VSRLLQTQPAVVANAKSKKQPKTSPLLVRFFIVVLPQQESVQRGKITLKPFRPKLKMITKSSFECIRDCVF
jgi:hypothetical protein